jgi:hypothetical protein
MDLSVAGYHFGYGEPTVLVAQDQRNRETPDAWPVYQHLDLVVRYPHDTGGEHGYIIVTS